MDTRLCQESLLLQMRETLCAPRWTVGLTMDKATIVALEHDRSAVFRPCPSIVGPLTCWADNWVKSHTAVYVLWEA
jgi:hypothetical protein